MQINKKIVTAELERFIHQLFLLPEVRYVQIRDVILRKGEANHEHLTEAIEKSYHDCYSDVDLSIMVQLSRQDTVTPAEYMKHMDRFGIRAENSLGFFFVEVNSMYRIIMKNGMRYDFGFEFEYTDDGEPVRFSSAENAPDNPDWPMEHVNRFWFVQIQALGKLYRKDFLISSHLANMNLNETLVQQMVLRDRKYGTNHHRYGYAEELAYIKNQQKCPIHTEDSCFNLIADKIYCAALT